MSVLMFITIMLVGMLGVFAAQASLQSRAREAARSAAVQPDLNSARGVVARLAGTADSEVTANAEWVTVRLSRDLRMLQLPTTFKLRAAATSYLESPW